MSRISKLIRNLVILISMLGMTMFISQGRYNPDKVFENNEISYNIGPSTVLEKWEEDELVIYFSEYDKWLSLTVLKKGFLGMWYMENHSVHGERYIDTRVQPSTGQSYNPKKEFRSFQVFGYINDKEIKKLSLQINQGETNNIINLDEKYNNGDKFLFYYQDNGKANLDIENLIGYDESGKIIYKKELK